MPNSSDMISPSLPFTVFTSPLKASTSFLSSLRPFDFSESAAMATGGRNRQKERNNDRFSSGEGGENGADHIIEKVMVDKIKLDFCCG